jgi:ABC-type Mn2+/Zn2+ transport system permease subunit
LLHLRRNGIEGALGRELNVSASVTSSTHVHRLHEDIVAGFTGILMVALGVAFLSKASRSCCNMRPGLSSGRFSLS